MASVELQRSVERLHRASVTDLGDVIAMIGEPEFPSYLLGYINASVQAEHIEIIHLTDKQIGNLGAASLDWDSDANELLDLYIDRYAQRDPTLQAVREASAGRIAIQRATVAKMPPSGLRDMLYRRWHVAERLFVSGPQGSGIMIGLLRSELQGPCDDLEFARLSAEAATLLSIAAKHAKLISRENQMPLALASLQEIEGCIAQSVEPLPQREVEVCARILHGVSSLGIALELDIGEETVKTYRKRAYSRLGIGTQRELLIWYLQQWRSLYSRPGAVLSGRFHHAAH
jgi:DNA-binding CsgD family transcriptional regulator